MCKEGELIESGSKHVEITTTTQTESKMDSSPAVGDVVQAQQLVHEQSHGQVSQQDASRQAAVQKPVLTFDQIAERTIEDFDNKEKDKRIHSGLELDIQNSNLSELRKRMLMDNEEKSSSYQLMEKSVLILLNLKDKNDRIRGGQQGRLMDYGDALDFAENSVRNYRVTHNKLFHFTKTGRERFKICCRLQELVVSLRQQVRSEIIKYQQEQESQEEETREDFEEIIDTGAFTAEEAGKEMKDWLLNGAAYKATLKKIVKGDETLSQDKETLLKFLEDKNRLLIANKMTLSMMLDEHPEVTLGLPSLKKKVKDYFDDLFEKSDDNRELLYLEVQDFRYIVETEIDNYKSDNSELLQRVEERKTVLLEKLEASERDSTLWEREEVNYLLTSDEVTKERFEERLEILADQKKENEDLIDRLVDEGKFCYLTKPVLKEKLKEKQKSLLIFGGEIDVAEHAKKYMEVIHYLCPDEATVEDRINDFMKNYSIPAIYKDSFVRYLAQSGDRETAVSNILNGDPIELEIGVQNFYDNMCTNKKILDKAIKGKELTRSQWKEIDKLELMAGRYSSKKKFRDLVNNITRSIDSGVEMTRDEFRNGIREKKRGIGLSARILGDLFLDSADVKEVLNEEEIGYLRENLMSELAANDEERIALESSATSEIKKLAYTMLRNLQTNKDKIKELRESPDYETIVKRKALLRLTTAGHGEDPNLFSKIISDADAEYKEGTALEAEMKDVKECLFDCVPKSADISLKASKLGGRIVSLKSYEGGRYYYLTNLFTNKPDFYTRIMNLTDEEFDTYVKTELDGKFKDLGEALKESKTGDAIKSIFLEKNFEEIYSGKMKGLTIYWKKQISGFEEQFFDEKQADGSTINKNTEEVVKEAFKKLIKAKGKKAVSMNDIWAIASILSRSVLDDRAKLDVLTSKDRFTDEIVKAYERQVTNSIVAREMFAARLEDIHSPFYEEDAEFKKIREAQFRGYLKDSIFKDEKEFLKTVPDIIKSFEEKQTAQKVEKLPDNAEDVRRGVLDKIDAERSRQLKNSYIGLDAKVVADTLSEVYQKKTLVNVGTKNNIDLSHSSWNVAREELTHRLTALNGENLSPFLIDCLIEKNVTKWYDEAINRAKPVKWIVRNLMADGFATLQEHAEFLTRVRSVLSRPDDGEDPVSDDELNLMLVNVYRNEDKFLRTGDEEHHSLSKTVIKGKWYKEFRANYKLLKAFEDMEVKDPVLDQERIGLSRDMRALLSTGLGITDQDEKAVDDFFTLIGRSTKYIQYSDKAGKVIGDCLAGNAKYKDLDEFTRRQYVTALRAYFIEELTARLSSGEEFDEDSYKEIVNEVISDDIKMRFMINNETALGSQTARKNKNFAEVVGSEAIDKIIEKYAWHGQRNKYKALNAGQKELFALCLMIMDKNAIGLEGGSNTVLQNSSLRKKEVGARIVELKKFMAGEPYDFKIDYAQAVSKLTNFGYNSVNSLKTKLSDTAFNKAIEFAEGIQLKMDMFGESDTERMDDCESVIFEASMLGKTENAEEVHRLRQVKTTCMDVKDILIGYGVRDGEEIEKKLGRWKHVPLKYHSTKIEDETRKEVVNRLKDMDELDMKKLICILQNRSVLDKSTAQKGKVINEEKREELKLMFLEENENSVFSSYMSNGAGFQALMSALSFRMKDTRTFGERALGKDDFDGSSLDRTALIDWNLLKRAFEFLDEVKRDRVAAYAVKNATDYIEYTGNEAAIKEYKELKGKTDIDADALMDFVEKQAKLDSKSGKNEDAIIAVGGFKALNERQKALFFKVLGRRDFLDISKRNLYRNIYSSEAERGFVNELGRYRLIDEYIDKSLGGNKGITLDDGACYEAMKSLLSTQVDDTADFNSADNVRDVLAGEKYYIFQRDTAIDWKLFNRALQFVNRAEYEMKLREGNAELYRSAGSLSKYGHLSMDYSILRKNIHKTGNQFVRFGAQRGKEFVGPDLLKKLQINVFGITIEPGSIIEGITTVCQAIIPDTKFTDVMSEIKSELVDGKTDEKYFSKGGKAEPKTKGTKAFMFKYSEDQKKIEESREKADKTAITYIDKVANGMNNIFENAKIMESGAEEVGSVIKMLVVTPIEEQRKKDKEEEEKSVIDEQLKGVNVRFRYGDVRDSITSFREKYKKVQEYHGYVQAVPLEKQYETKLVNLVKVQIIEGFASAMLNTDGKLKGISSALSAGYERQKSIKLEDLKKSKLKELIQKKEVPENYQFTEDDIKNHKYWKPEEEELNDQDKLKAASDTAKDYFEGVLGGIFGKDKLEDLKSTVTDIQKFTDGFREKMAFVSSVIGAAKNYGTMVYDIAQRAKNKMELSRGKKRAQSDEVKTADAALLTEAEKYQTDEQKKLSKDTAEHHGDLGRMAHETADTMQNIEISRDVFDMAIQTGELIAQAYGVSSKVIAPVVGAVKFGIDYALYVARVLKDRSMLEDYYKNTRQGKEVLDSIVGGTVATFGREESEAQSSAMKKQNVLDIICAGKGYENKDELVTDAGLQIATSIAFSASNYNPVMENKIMAATVLVVLGLRDKIGQTDAGTIQSIFDAMKAA